METINSVAAAAAKAVWGEPEAQNEPVSGVKGNTSQGEPYDAGNLPTPSQNKVENQFETRNNDPESEGAFSRPAEGPATAITDTHTHTHETPSNLETKAAVKRDTNAAINPETTNPASSYATETTEKKTEGLSGASEGLSSKSETAETTSTKKDAASFEEGTTKNPNELEGAGPRPVETVAKENGGDAGNVTAQSESNAAKEKKPVESEEGTNASEGTGEEYVRTTGFAADGGNFDATNPGAGREADRLWEEKGHSTEGSSEGLESKHDKHVKHDKHDKADKADKPSLGERIKAKLHKH